MADIPVEGTVVVEKKDAPLTVEQQLAVAQKDIAELARGVNVQAALLESIVMAFESVIKSYLTLTRKTDKPNEETPKA